MSEDRAGPVLALLGPTACGKSDLAVEVALVLAGRGSPGEVVTVDSAQLYRGMDVGTATPTPTERRGVPHHLLDVLDPAEPADVALVQRLAREAVRDVLGRGGVPLVVGGSGLYARAVLDDLELPPTDPTVRTRLEAEVAEVGSPALHARLARVDPAAAAAVLPTNDRRVVRALEVVELTGRPFAASLPRDPRPVFADVRVLLTRPLAEIDARVEARVDAMLGGGLVEEVRHLADAHGLREGVTARRAVGYAQVLRHLDGELSLDEVRAQVVVATRRLARRQLRWFRRDPSLVVLEARADAPVTADDVLAVLDARHPRPLRRG